MKTCKKIVWILIVLVNTQLHAQTVIYPTDTAAWLKRKPQTYADMHMHSSLKAYYNNTHTPTNTFYDNYSNWRQAPKFNKSDFEAGNQSDFINYYQCSYGCLFSDSVNYSIVCASITPIEKSNVDGVKIHAAKMVSKLPKNRLLADRYVPGFDEFMGEYNFIQVQATTLKPGGRNILPVKTNGELIDCFRENNTPLIINIEGGQVLYGPINTVNVKCNSGPLKENGCKDCSSKVNKNGKKINNNCPYCLTKDDWFNEILLNIDRLKQLQPYPVFSIGLAHFNWLRTTGNAKSLDKQKYRKTLGIISKSVKARKVLFNKHKEGFLTSANDKPYPCGHSPKHNYIDTNVTVQILDKLLDQSNKKHRILIDIKHMDIASRMQYYEYLSKKTEKIPIVCSHTAMSGENFNLAAFTGLWPNSDKYSEITNTEGFYKNLKDNNPDCLPDELPEHAGWFYPWSINLYDEEVKIICRSGGIIGLIMEQRALGAEMYKYDDKHTKEVEDYLKNNYPAQNYSAKEYVSVEPMMRNLLYIIEKADTTLETAWHLVCIGSDYDGIIDPLDVAPTAQSSHVLESLLRKYLPVFDKLHYKNESLLLPDKDGITAMDRMMNLFFEENLKNFLIKNF